MGYGGRALQLLKDYYEGRIPNLAETEPAVESAAIVEKDVSINQ